jgi:Icc protein
MSDMPDLKRHLVDPVSFVHISDTHLGASADYSRHGQRSWPCAERVVEIINGLPVRPDFVVHTGDVVTEPDPAAYQLAAQLFSRLGVPIYYVNGNHDTTRDIRRHLPMGPIEMLGADPDRLFYRFRVKGYEFMVLDARAPDELDPHGLMPRDQLETMHRLLNEDGPPTVVFGHFPVVPMNSVWMDAYMRVINWEDLHRVLANAVSRLRGYFHGHVHQNTQTMRDGVLYVSVASTFAQFSAWPNDLITGFDPDHLPGYNFVQLLPEQTIIQQHTYLRPAD